MHSQGKLESSERRIALGKALFFDERLGADSKVSCAMYHRPNHAFAGAPSTPTGVHGRTLTRNVPSLADTTQAKPRCWDGRCGTVEEIAFAAFLDPNEFGQERPKDVGHFLNPGLRNVALTAHYMHDTKLTTLQEAVERGARSTRSGTCAKGLEHAPTIEIRPGLKFVIMVTRDIVLPPWQC